jgi:hypothetical protein
MTESVKILVDLYKVFDESSSSIIVCIWLKTVMGLNMRVHLISFTDGLLSLLKGNYEFGGRFDRLKLKSCD